MADTGNRITPGESLFSARRDDSRYLTSKYRKCAKCGRPAMFLARLCHSCWIKAMNRV